LLQATLALSLVVSSYQSSIAGGGGNDGDHASGRPHSEDFGYEAGGTVSENSLCMLFANDARRQLHNIFMQFGDDIQTARQLL